MKNLTSKLSENTGSSTYRTVENIIPKTVSLSSNKRTVKRRNSTQKSNLNRTTTKKK